MLGFPIHCSWGLRLLGFQLLGFYCRASVIGPGIMGLRGFRVHAITSLFLRDLGVSEIENPNIVPEMLGSLLIRTPNKVPLIFGNSHLEALRVAHRNDLLSQETLNLVCKN